ncbi:MAG: DUF6265 family protein [Bacteroidia bacterium]|jgi:hypothetical protein
MRAFVVVIYCLSSCMLANGQGPNEIARWLVGTWLNTAFSHTETWRQEGNILKGFGLAVEGNDTLFYERLEISLATNPVVYRSWVKGQNNGVGIEFNLKEATDTSWFFENPKHDFPKKIHYIKTGASTLEVFVFGHENSRLREEHFFFIRKAD